MSYSKPKKEHNFFQSYRDHLNHLTKKVVKDLNIPITSQPENVTDVFKTLKTISPNTLSEQALARLNLFKPLRDGHDYFDEVTGATALPLLSMVVSIGLTAKAIWDGTQSLAIKTGLKKDDQQNHGELALVELKLAAVAIILGLASFIKSAISLLTRPIATLLHGFDKQNVDRFSEEISFN